MRELADKLRALGFNSITGEYITGPVSWALVLIKRALSFLPNKLTYLLMIPLYLFRPLDKLFRPFLSVGIIAQ
jgi:hypothetical protein